MLPRDIFLSAYRAEIVTADQIKKLGQEAFSKIANGKGQVKILTSWSVAGESFSQMIGATPMEVLAACNFALKRINGAPSVIYPRFLGDTYIDPNDTTPI